jgi:hypothetical protein
MRKLGNYDGEDREDGRGSSPDNLTACYYINENKTRMRKGMETTDQT